MLNQLFFNSQRCRCFCIDQTDAFAYTKHMGIYGHIGLLINDTGNDVGSLSTHTRQLHQFFYGQWHFAVELIH